MKENGTSNGTTNGNGDTDTSGGVGVVDGTLIESEKRLTGNVNFNIFKLYFGSGYLTFWPAVTVLVVLCR
jgi:hypothetical protein